MPNISQWFLKYRSNVFSQLGEDGVISKVIDTLPTKDHWCVEFGAWDGIHNSNTRNLIVNKDYSAILIEGEKRKFQELVRNYQHSQKIIPLNKFVGFYPSDGLDSILEGTSIPNDFDFLSIDIDGNDFHVWKAIERYHPKCVCIEYNHTIPTEVKFIQKPDPKVNQGSSLASLVELGTTKGYELVAALDCNALFVKKEYFILFNIEDNRPEELRTGLENITYIFSGFDGTVFLRGKNRLALHDIDLRESKVQHLPNFLRHHRDSFRLVQKLAFGLLIMKRNPKKFIAKILNRFKASK